MASGALLDAVSHTLQPDREADVQVLQAAACEQRPIRPLLLHRLTAVKHICVTHRYATSQPVYTQVNINE